MAEVQIFFDKSISIAKLIKTKQSIKKELKTCMSTSCEFILQSNASKSFYSISHFFSLQHTGQ